MELAHNVSREFAEPNPAAARSIDLVTTGAMLVSWLGDRRRGCPCSNLHEAEKDWRFSRAGHTVTVMVTILGALLSILEFRVRSRASLELELIALRHQVTVLRRQRPGRPQLSALDRLLWVWLYRIWPQVIDAMVLVKPATVVQWHRKGFGLYWRWRSRRPGRPKIDTEIQRG